ncbi:unnamed protein product [Clonostachys rosea]|uniref:Uncharacterized protein n=1 Tax=Bionectria ochroleuca TaxID=29856 RepID=A0ABY6UCQ3_BIOOC|nr:unnamed protein product [Clonostachys rosea]
MRFKPDSTHVYAALDLKAPSSQAIFKHIQWVWIYSRVTPRDINNQHRTHAGARSTLCSPILHPFHCLVSTIETEDR